jgi:chaperonin GroEL (HSP60 family)
LRQTDSHLSPIFKVFADALEAIPMIVLQNCGYDPSKILLDIQKSHLSEDGLWKGINVKNGKNFDVLTRSENGFDGILEPCSVMRSIISSATDAAEMILRIDTTVLIEPKKTPEELGLF